MKRQRVPFPPPNHRSFYDILDLNVGKEIEIYGRVYKITNCDNFTRTFLNRCGIPVPDPINVPDDPYKQFRASVFFLMFKQVFRNTVESGKARV